MPSSTTARRTLAVAILAALALVVAAACSSTRPEAPAGAALGEGESAAAVTTDPPPPPEPDVLPDPEVAPGTCEWRTYTPPTAEHEQQGKICRPADDQRDVAVVLVHGGGGIEGAPSSLDGWARRLNVEGYVTMQVQYHLFSPGTAGPVFPLPEQNVKAAVQLLRGSGDALGIRKDRIAVQGHSAGARIGAVAFTSADETWFGGDELWPDISDRVDAFVGFYHPYDGTMMYSTTYFGGSEASTDPEVVERWAEADSLTDARRADAPALFVTGSDDWSVIDEQQDEFAGALERDRQTGRSVIIDGGGHGFDLGGSRLTRLGEEAATHVLEFLNDVFPQDPGRPAQAAEVDLSRAPTGTGTPATTTPVRTRRSTSGSSSSGSGTSGSGSGSGSSSRRTTTTQGGGSTTTVGGSTTTGVSPSTTAPAASSTTTAAPPVPPSMATSTTAATTPPSSATTVAPSTTAVTTPPLSAPSSAD